MLQLITPPSYGAFANDLAEMHRLRYRVFKVRLDWDVMVVGEMERDQFDDLHPVYLLQRDRDGRVCGCTRLLPTLGPTMLRDVFPAQIISRSHLAYFRFREEDMSEKRLQGKVAVITGGALGLGKAIASRMCEEGARAAILDIRDGEGMEVARILSDQGYEAEYWRCNVSEELSVSSAIAAVADHFGKIDIVVNNAGVLGTNKPTHQTTEEEWDFVQAINVKGVFFVTKHAIPHLKRNGGGSIINLSSIYGIVGSPDVPPYHASKGAVRLMCKTDALLYASDHIRVNSIHPGFIWTPMVKNYLAEQGEIDENRKAIDALHPLGHIGEPDDIAWAAVYLASGQAKFVTGAELVVDGGYTTR